VRELHKGVISRKGTMLQSAAGRMGESTRQVEGLFESLLAEAF